jgi:hypothetical protein
MSLNLLEPILVGALGIAASVTGLVTIVYTLEALRAKLRARAYLYRASLGDEELHHILAVLEHSEKVSQQEIASSIATLEGRLSALSDRDKAYLSKGLHQPSVNGVKRFAKELATAY